MTLNLINVIIAFLGIKKREPKTGMRKIIKIRITLLRIQLM